MQRILSFQRQFLRILLRDKLVLGIVISSFIALTMLVLIAADDRKVSSSLVTQPDGQFQDAITVTPTIAQLTPSFKITNTPVPSTTQAVTPTVTSGNSAIKVSGIYFDENFNKVTFTNMRMTITDTATNKSSFAYGQEWNESLILPLTPGKYFFRPYPQGGYDSYVASCGDCDYKKLSYTSYDGIELSLSNGDVRHVYVQYRKAITPTPVSRSFNPSCLVTTLGPNPTSGTAPLIVNTLYASAQAGGSFTISGYQWDFDGDGTWDEDVSENPVSHTYINPGTYSPVYRVKGSDGSLSETCQYNYKITVQ